MSRADERGFVSFLRTPGSIQIFETFAPTPAELAVEDFSDALRGHWTYHIWNRQFDWVPEYGLVGHESADAERTGWAFHRNASTAPFLEVTRSDLAGRKAGRLYWGSDFSAPDGLRYDAPVFDSWIDSIWRWCRRRARRMHLADQGHVWVFAGAEAAMPSA